MRYCFFLKRIIIIIILIIILVKLAGCSPRRGVEALLPRRVEGRRAQAADGDRGWRVSTAARTCAAPRCAVRRLGGGARARGGEASKASWELKLVCSEIRLKGSQS